MTQPARKGNPVVGLVVLFAIGAAVLFGAKSCLHSQNKHDAAVVASITVTVQSSIPEDANHVAVVTAWRNTGTNAATEVCDIVVNDTAGTQIGDKVDGPADKIPPGQQVTIRDLIKTSVDTSNVGTTGIDQTSCSAQ